MTSPNVDAKGESPFVAPTVSLIHAESTLCASWRWGREAGVEAAAAGGAEGKEAGATAAEGGGAEDAAAAEEAEATGETGSAAPAHTQQ